MKSTRLQRFQNLKQHPYYCRYMDRLSTTEKQACIDFINENGNLEPSHWEPKVIRMNLDNPNKPKQWSLIEDLLIAIK